MQGANDLLKQLKEKIKRSTGFSVTTSTVARTFDQDAYSSDLKGSNLHVVAGSIRGHLFALSNLLFAAKRSVLPEALGSKSPKFIGGAIWFNSNSKQGNWVIPSWLTSEAIPQLAAMLYHLGFGRIILGQWSGSNNSVDPKKKSNQAKATDPSTPLELANLLAQLADYGIEVVIKPEGLKGSPIAPDYQANIQKIIESTLEILPKNGSILWESNPFEASFRDHPKADQLLTYDLVLEELAHVEQAVNGRSLIYSISTLSDESIHQQTEWLARFVDQVGPHTTVAFSSQEGAPWEDHKRNHPIWQQLVEEKIISGTPLQSIMNVGAINYGEALWPTVPCREIDQLILRMRRHPFHGPIVLAPRLAEEGSFLEASLWVMGQALWSTGSSEEHLQSWIRGRFSEEDPVQVAQTILLIRQTLIEIHSLLAEEKNHSDSKETGSKWVEYRRFQVDSLLARLNGIRSIWNLTEKKEGADQFRTSLRYFLRDAKRMIFYFLQSNNLSVANVLTGEDMLEGYWTKMESQPGKGIGAGGRVILLDAAGVQ